MQTCVSPSLPADSNSLAELPPLAYGVQLQTQKLAELGSNELWELTRKCHLFRSLDLSGWKGVSVLAFRSLGLAAGASLESVGRYAADRAFTVCCRLICFQQADKHPFSSASSSHAIYLIDLLANIAGRQDSCAPHVSIFRYCPNPGGKARAIPTCVVLTPPLISSTHQV